MNTFSFIFLFFLILNVFCQTYLVRRQIRYVTNKRSEVPFVFQEKITLSEHQKAADYTVAKMKLSRWEIWTEGMFWLILLFGGVLSWWINWVLQVLPGQDLLSSLTLIFGVFFANSLLGLGINYYKTFVIDEKFGFNRMSVKLFISDFFKQGSIGLIFGAVIVATALWLMQKDVWWLWLWGAWVIFSLFMLLVYPTFIAPLFNKFSPLENIALKERIGSLLKKCGFESDGLFVMNGSLRSNHGNAYFTGVGKAKRVVFFDTLLEKLNADEIEAVLAHELGHFKKNHVKKRMACLFTVGLISLAVLASLSAKNWFFAGLFVDQSDTAMISNAVTLVLFMPIIHVFSFMLTPLMSYYSRLNEFEADEYASEQIKSVYLIDALVKLYRDNASTLTPDPWFSQVYHSHPPALQRIAKLQSLT